MFLTTTIIITH